MLDFEGGPSAGMPAGSSVGADDHDTRFVPLDAEQVQTVENVFAAVDGVLASLPPHERIKVTPELRKGLAREATKNPEVLGTLNSLMEFIRKLAKTSIAAL